MQIKDALFEAFKKDHAELGGALFSLRTKLAERDFKGAQKVAAEINRGAGAHIAFEESEFYPALRPFLSASEVEDMYAEHKDGLRLIVDIMNAPANFDPADNSEFIERIEKLESHVSDCGELFGAMGGLTDEQMERLWSRLNYWRDESPSWIEFDESSRAASA